jgi:ABC-type antimicrobial peptide transport system permease subunit
VAIVNETAARRWWAGEDPLGRRVSLDGPGGPFLEVVGVAADARYDEATEAARPFLYLPLAQTAFVTRTVLVARTAADPAPLLPALRDEIRRLDPNLPVFEATTLAGLAGRRLDKERGLGSLLTALGVLGLALAAIGLYGVTAQLVAHRRREIGLRLALGADRGRVLALLVRDGLRLALIGAGLGSVLALPLVLLLGGILDGLAPADLASVAAPILLLTAVAAGTAWLSARRSASLDPAAVLRSE